MMSSAIVNAEPELAKVPETVILPENVLSPAIACVPDVLITVPSTAIAPDVKSIPSPPLKCALTSEAPGPVYVTTPPLKANEPSPPASVTVRNDNASTYALVAASCAAEGSSRLLMLLLLILMLEPNLTPPVELIVLAAVMAMSDFSWIAPPDVSSKSPEPVVKILMFWLLSALNWIVPELSETTCCPLTYNDPGPTYMSLHCLLLEPKS